MSFLANAQKNRKAGEINIYAANVGDARAVLSCTGTTSNQKAYRLTHDHRADDPEEVARIEAAGGFVARSRVLGILAVARSMGDHGMKEFVIGKPFSSVTKVAIDNVDSSQDTPCISSEFVILACDGLWDVMEDQEAVDLVRRSVFGSADQMQLSNLSPTDVLARKEKMEKAAQILVDTAMQNGSTDNITAVVYWL
jgi:serine/threonine protein phosphatase PrpC